MKIEKIKEQVVNLSKEDQEKLEKFLEAEIKEDEAKSVREKGVRLAKLTPAGIKQTFLPNGGDLDNSVSYARLMSQKEFVDFMRSLQR